jgi:selenocysteine lyase/cysteine desulfurase
MSGRLDRRDLLVRGGLLAGATAVGAAGGYAAAQGLDEDSQAAQGTTPEDRGALFSLDPAYTNLTTFLLASHPRPVREAIERHREALDASTALYLHEAEPAFEEEARAAAADYLGTRPELVALTDSTTMGLGLVYAGLRLEPGDEVLTTEHDFYSTHEALRLREERDGVRVRRVRLYPPDAPERASADAIVGALADSIAPATRAVAVTWVHSSSGVKLPLREIAGAVAAANEGRDDAERVLLCVDGIHGFGAEDASPVELGADVFVSGCHKWIFGPRGTGLVWAAEHAWPRIAPTIPPFDGQTFVSWITGEAPAGEPPGAFHTPGGYHSFEHRWALTEAFSVHADDLGGRAAVAEHTRGLAARLKEGLAGIPGVSVKTPGDDSLSSGLVCAEIGIPPRDAVDRLREEHRVLASVTPYATEYLRFGPSVANSEADVDRAVQAVAAIA